MPFGVVRNSHLTSGVKGPHKVSCGKLILRSARRSKLSCYGAFVERDSLLTSVPIGLLLSFLKLTSENPELSGEK